jgi:hypothetical protein
MWPSICFCGRANHAGRGIGSTSHFCRKVYSSRLTSIELPKQSMIDDGGNAFEEEDAPNAWIDNHASVLQQTAGIKRLFYHI